MRKFAQPGADRGIAQRVPDRGIGHVAGALVDVAPEAAAPSARARRRAVAARACARPRSWRVMAESFRVPFVSCCSVHPASRRRMRSANSASNIQQWHGYVLARPESSQVHRISLLTVDTHRWPAYSGSLHPHGRRQGGRYEHPQQPSRASLATGYRPRRGACRWPPAPAASPAPTPARPDGGGAGGTDPETFTVMTANENPMLEEQLTALVRGRVRGRERGPAARAPEGRAGRHGAEGHAAREPGRAARPHDRRHRAHPPRRRPRRRRPRRRPEGRTRRRRRLGQRAARPRPPPSSRSTAACLDAVPVQHRGHLVQQGDLRRATASKSPRPGTSSSTRPTRSQAAGVTPITEAGANGWPLTRIMGMYIFRNVGPDAMAAVRDGDAKLTDPDYVAGAAGARRLRRGRLLRRGLLDARRRHVVEHVPHRPGRDDVRRHRGCSVRSTTRSATRSAARTSASCRSPTSRAARAHRPVRRPTPALR